MQRGLTLLELMLVMVVMGIVLGLGLGAFTALESPDNYALSVVRSTLRAASNQALSRDSQARVVFVREGDPEAPGMLVSELFTAGTWHFEDADLKGAFGANGTSLNGRVADDGFIGSALSLGVEGSEARFDVAKDPAFDPTHGFVIELAIRPIDHDEPSGHVLNLGRVVGLDLMPGGAVRGWIAPVFEDGVSQNPDAAISSFLFVETPPAIVKPGQWSRVRLTYDRRTLAIDVNGQPFERLSADLAVRQLAGELVLSSRERQGFRGDVDKLVTSFYHLSEPVPMPSDVIFPRQAPREIVFDGSGGLDVLVHQTDVLVPVRFLDSTEGFHDATVLVNLQGTIE
jgi:prepilin-type N-terminal cleavage/methylation domain-containing protein